LKPSISLVAGRIAYRNAAGAETGHERFELVSHSGGHVLRALCDMAAIDLLRDVTLAMDANWRPIDGFCRIIKHGTRAAASCFALTPASVDITTFLGDDTCLHQHIALSAPLDYLGLHPLQGDALIAQIRGTSAPGTFISIAAVTNSISPNGDEGLTGTTTTIDVAYLGDESLTVTAGTFAARRYQLRWRSDWPAADMWIEAATGVFLLMRWTMIEDWYELTALQH
jgi:hypothetical protein